jgi:HK97 family phage major capsid protein
MRRFVTITPDEIEKRSTASGDLVIDMAMSSELPAERWWGIEILDHGPKSIRLERLNDGASVLFNHNPNELRGIHIPGSARVDSDAKLRAKVQLTSATEAGRETIGLVESRMLTKSSVGYAIHKVVESGKSGKSREIDGATFERMIEQHESKRDRAAFYRSLDSAIGPFQRAVGEVPTYRVVDWEPLENSLVTIPVDHGVGIGRSESEPRTVRTDAAAAANRGATMDEGTQGGAAGAPQPAQPNQPVDAATQERIRVGAIMNLARQNYGQGVKITDDMRQAWISDGNKSANAVADEILALIVEATKSQKPPTEIGLTPKETRNYSLWKALRAVVDQNWRGAEFELEASRACATKLNRTPEQHTLLIPYEVQRRTVPYTQQSFMLGGQRDISVAANGGGFLVETSNVGFIELLRNRSVCFRMGVERMTGLVGNVNIPKQSAAATGYWLASETTQITESQQTFVQIPLSPKTVGAYTEISRLLLLQSSPGAEAIVTNDLSSVVALAADLGILAGTGTSQPQGIIGTSGLGALTSGTGFDYADIIEFQSKVASANVQPVRGGYVTTPTVAGLAMARVKFANTATPLWDGNIWDATVAGFTGLSSMQVPTGDMLFGDWSTVVVGEWGVLEIAVNPVANFQAGIIGIRCMYSMDVGVRYPAAFVLGTGMT